MSVPMKRFVFFVVPSCLIVLFLFSSFWILYFFLIHSNGYFQKSTKLLSTNFGAYQISNYNKITNISTKSYVKLSKKLLNSNKIEYISFYSSNNNIHSVISKVRETSVKFECFGHCFCNSEKQQNRRSNIISTAVSRSFYFAVSVVSLSLAISISKNYFREECLMFLENTCPEESAESDVDNCEIINSEETNDELEIEYLCRGHCLPNNKIRKADALIEREIFHCEEKEVEGNVFVSSEKLKANSNQIAKFKFSKKVSQYCKEVSEIHLERIYGIIIELKSIKLCVGLHSKSQYSNIHCQSKY